MKKLSGLILLLCFTVNAETPAERIARKSKHQLEKMREDAKKQVGMEKLIFKLQEDLEEANKRLLAVNQTAVQAKDIANQAQETANALEIHAFPNATN